MLPAESVVALVVATQRVTVPSLPLTKELLVVNEKLPDAPLVVVKEPTLLEPFVTVRVNPTLDPSSLIPVIEGEFLVISLGVVINILGAILSCVTLVLEAKYAVPSKVAVTVKTPLSKLDRSRLAVLQAPPETARPETLTTRPLGSVTDTETVKPSVAVPDI